ncbi:apolipoprotein N-acyltransferase [Novipirellula rosea]|uniref:Apolipoprotein N-acyltransferase n=1 Tax=Novipirellula rosea TaxID=1031540 RepID=A0ABP8NQV3_9BACT
MSDDNPTAPANDNASGDPLANTAWNLPAVLLKCAAIAVVIGVPWLYPNWFLLGSLGWVALIMFAARRRRLTATAGSFLIGMISLGIAFHWAPKSISSTTNLSETMSHVVFLGLVAWESLAFAMLGYSASALSQPPTTAEADSSRGRSWLWLLVPIWVAIEFFHPQIFGWSLAHTVLAYLPLIQIAEVTGTSGVAFLVMLATVSLARLGLHHECRRDWIEFGMGASLIASACIAGQWRASQWQDLAGQADSIRVAAVQVDPSKMGSVSEMQRMSRSAQTPIDLYIWPESSLGHYHISLENFRDEVQTAMNSEAPNPAIDPFPGVPSELLAGGKTYDDGGRDQGPYKNTAFLIDSTKSIRSRYVKRSLLPIGEYVPGETWFPFLRDWAALDSTLLRGADDAPLTLAGNQKVGVLVCYEDMVAENSAATTREGAECLIALINGSRFTDVDTLQQHLWLAQLRAVENRRSLVRCAATGVSCLVQPDGAITDRLTPQQSGMIVASVPLLRTQTIYTRYGDWFVYLATAIAMIGVIVMKANRRRRADRQPANSN